MKRVAAVRVLVVLGAAMIAAGCGGSGSSHAAARTSAVTPTTARAGPFERAQDRATQSDLRNALTAEKTVYVDNQEYDASPKNMKQVESSLGWGVTLAIVVGDASTARDNNVVCLDEQSKSGTWFAIGDVAVGALGGTYFGQGRECPRVATPKAVAALGTTWLNDNTSSNDDPPAGSVLRVQTDLRTALTAEKTVYTDQQTYSTQIVTLKDIENTLDWGGKLMVVVGDAVSPGDKGAVCVSEVTAAGSAFSLGDVAAGPDAGTYYGKVACPAPPTAANLSALGTSW